MLGTVYPYMYLHWYWVSWDYMYVPKLWVLPWYWAAWDYVPNIGYYVPTFISLGISYWV